MLLSAGLLGAQLALGLLILLQLNDYRLAGSEVEAATRHLTLSRCTAAARY